MNLISYISIAYGCACVGVIGFQLALIAGAPWGALTQGGKNEGALPSAGRIAAFVSIFVVAAMACAILSAAGLWPQWPNWTKWVALTVQCLVTVLNWITPSKPERTLWGPLTSIMLALAVLVVFAA
ncbi:hypothetical protein E2K80_05800 [Rhodophyticola sp. CCM32]|uniref:hypothetical protein n=1 Tax=Rhodophyticola sp. CCM32 TaxID=2916397 RepID=UPI00107F1BE6|nr:hypothetical protein [Rhodophyticola sp. CCM32]QBY00310.1 hypothetical protein E2K80_05800 [Rhodophyticola sp. CCM32]